MKTFLKELWTSILATVVLCVVVSGVSKQKHSRQCDQDSKKQRIVSVVCRFEGDPATGRHLGGDTSGKVVRNLDFRHSVERTSQT